MPWISRCFRFAHCITERMFRVDRPLRRWALGVKQRYPTISQFSMATEISTSSTELFSLCSWKFRLLDFHAPPQALPMLAERTKRKKHQKDSVRYHREEVGSFHSLLPLQGCIVCIAATKRPEDVYGDDQQPRVCSARTGDSFFHPTHNDHLLQCCFAEHAHFPSCEFCGSSCSYVYSISPLRKDGNPLLARNIHVNHHTSRTMRQTIIRTIVPYSKAPPIFVLERHVSNHP